MDHDIDPSNMFNLVWAMATLCDPINDIAFIRHAWGQLDPRIQKGVKENSRAVFMAVRPYYGRKDFPPVAESSPELRAATLEKFAHLLKGLQVSMKGVVFLYQAECSSSTGSGCSELGSDWLIRLQWRSGVGLRCAKG